jgi:8-oxo-dGTP diphosphatase
MTMTQIHIAAAAITRDDGKFLLVRKQGTSKFMQAGGKLDRGEDARMALVRELYEELALSIEPQHAQYLGQFCAPAANEAGMSVLADQFLLHIDVDVSPMAELEEICWVTLDEALELPLAPLLKDVVIPLLKSR